MWMKRLLKTIKMPKFRRNHVTHVQCYRCHRVMTLAEAYVDGKGYIWCSRCR